ncbi:cell division protein FtsQ/DivIB [Actinomadura sp. NEAU-AAG7]|uniref:cell division protein FtsQ/DivIB n=1 Tax=Actinomadura sp. NEAU-AAG7 TaxID=2839640 RepID=UPI001BE4AFAC|nr:FtsQ-type POTRA domain-containing protein [Actinomadura sp. NEAU-AAG7]MBT2209826.1 FtsQ-type POTRA domain-containing protein [Actinomadura sp. NEAU-AAG7]
MTALPPETETGTGERPETGAVGADPAPRGRRRPSRWKAAFAALLVLGVLAAVTWVLLGSRLLVVRDVEVSGARLVQPDRVVAAAGVRLGVPMVRLDTGAVRARVEGLREVESARVERRWPATVRVIVRERVPVAVLRRGGSYRQIDRFGVTVVEGASRPAGLPTLTVASPGPSDPATLAALRVLTDLPGRLRTRLTDVAATGPGDVVLHLSDGPVVVWGPAERAAEKVRLLEALRRTAAGRAARTIDVSSPEVVTTR